MADSKDFLIARLGELGIHPGDSGKRDFTMEHTYATSIEDVWSAITEPERLARWMGPVTGTLSVSGEFLLLFDEDDEQQRAWGRIERCEAPHALEVTWDVPGESPGSRVLVELAPEDIRTRLTLTHSGLDVPQASGYAAGWHTYLEALGAELSAGELAALDWDTRWGELFPHHR